MDNVNKILENIAILQKQAIEMKTTSDMLDANINELINDSVKKANSDDVSDLNYILAQKNRIIEKAKRGEDFQNILATLQNKYKR